MSFRSEMYVLLRLISKKVAWVNEKNFRISWFLATLNFELNSEQYGFRKKESSVIHFISKYIGKKLLILYSKFVQKIVLVSDALHFWRFRRIFDPFHQIENKSSRYFLFLICDVFRRLLASALYFFSWRKTVRKTSSTFQKNIFWKLFQNGIVNDACRRRTLSTMERFRLHFEPKFYRNETRIRFLWCSHRLLWWEKFH